MSDENYEEGQDYYFNSALKINNKSGNRKITQTH
jgi:hypothetical protein